MFSSIYFLIFFAYFWGSTNAANKSLDGGWGSAFSNGSTLIPLVHFGDKSYYFGVTFQATFLEADQFCRDIHMELVRVQSSAENDFLYKYTQESTKFENFWTAGSKLLDKKNWIWMSTGEIIEYTNWGNNEPDNPDTELCLELWLFKNKGLYFDDRDCTSKFAFICEKDKHRSQVTTEENSAKWSSVFESSSVSPNINLLHFGHKSYYFGTIFKATYLQATQFCQMIDMQLVSIFGDEENSRLHKYLRDTGVGTNFWSSGTKAIDGKTWVWLSEGVKVNYTHWLSGQPDSTTELCIELVQKKEEGLFWNDLSCGNTLNFICERYGIRLGPGPVIFPYPATSSPAVESGSTGGSVHGDSQPVINIYVNNNQCSNVKNATITESKKVVSCKNGDERVVEINNNLAGTCPGYRKAPPHY